MIQNKHLANGFKAAARLVKRIHPHTFDNPSSIRASMIFVIVAVTVVALVPFGGIVYRFTHQNEQAAWRERQTEAAEYAAQSVVSVLQRADDTLYLLNLLGADELEEDTVVFHEMYLRNIALLEVVRVAADGRTIAGAPDNDPVLQNLFTTQQSQWFQHARSGAKYYSDIQFTAKNVPYIIMSQPGSMGDVIAARLSMSFMRDVVRDIHFGEGGKVYVALHSGEIVAHTDPALAGSANIGSRPEFQAGINAVGKKWYGEYTNFQGEAVVGVTTSIPDTEWIIFTELPRVEAFANSRRALWFLSALIAITAVISAGLMMYLAGVLVVKPIEHLRDGAERIGGGSLSHRINLQRVDEIGQLSQAFDRMTANLEQRTRELADSRDELLYANLQLSETNQELQNEIANRMRVEEQLVHDAFHDALTGLPNRALFNDRLNRAIERYQRSPEHPFAVLFLDLDRFKVINDSLGHNAGDELLIKMAQILSMMLRSVDTVARLGGDEFVILLEGLRELEDATLVADRIIQELTAPINLSGREIGLSTSIGIVMSSPSYSRPEEVLRDADIALYRAKEMGKGRYEIFDASLRMHAIARMNMENELRAAIEREEFFLHYQPIKSLSSNHITGFEALLRWDSPQRGLISPMEFIPVAEETGMIVPIGRWVLKEACCQLTQWQQKYLSNPPLTINVNVSAVQLIHPDFLDHIREALEKSGLDASSLKLEITESVLMDHAGHMAGILTQLRDMGIQIQVDDFGTGYSSLAYLQRFPIQTIKIDRSFITRIGSTVNGKPENGWDDGLQKQGAASNGAEIVKTIVALAHDLGMEAVAEGIETQDQLAQLTNLHCTFGQGYLIARPMGSEAVDKLLATHYQITQPARPGGRNGSGPKGR